MLTHWSYIFLALTHHYDNARIKIFRQPDGQIWVDSAHICLSGCLKILILVQCRVDLHDFLYFYFIFISLQGGDPWSSSVRSSMAQFGKNPPWARAANDSKLWYSNQLWTCFVFFNAYIWSLMEKTSHPISRQYNEFFSSFLKRCI